MHFQRTAEDSDYEVLTANAFVRHDHYGIYLYHIPHPSHEIQFQGGNGKPSPPSIFWSSTDYSGPNRYGGLYYDRTDAVLPNFYLNNDRHSNSHTIEFGMNTPEDTEYDHYVRYPVVLNHTVTPTNDNLTLIRGQKGRKRACVSPCSTLREFHIETLLVDDPDKRGHFCTNLRQYGVADIVGRWTQRMEYDEVTGRILLHISGRYIDNPRPDIDRLLLADLSLARHENSHDYPPGPLDFGGSRAKRIDSGRVE